MNSALDLHDSFVAEVRQIDGTLNLRLAPAVVHRSPGTPGVSPGEVFAQDAQLSFRGVQAPSPIIASPGRISDGSVQVNGVAHSVLALPFLLAGAIEATIQFQSGSCLSVTASAVECLPFGDAQYVEPFAG